MPQQARGQRRVSHILDAAAEVFTETGYEAATTNAIAIRANTSIGSLYQFFPNKVAILNALALRYRTALDSLLDEIFTHAPDGLQPVLSLMIDRVAEFYGANPAFQPMFFASQSSKALSLVADTMCITIVEQVKALFMNSFPALDEDASEFYAVMIVYMTRTLIPLSFTEAERHRDHIIPELKRMVFAYLASLDAFRDQEFTFDGE